MRTHEQAVPQRRRLLFAGLACILLGVCYNLRRTRRLDTKLNPQSTTRPSTEEITAAAAAAAAAANATNAARAWPNPNRFIVTTAKSARSSVMSTLPASAKVVESFEVQKSLLTVVEFPSDVEASAYLYTAMGTAGTAAEIQSVEVDHPRYLVPTKSTDPPGRRLSESTPWGIRKIFELEKGVASYPWLGPNGFDDTKLPSITHPLCIIDSGYELDHPDLPSTAAAADPRQVNLPDALQDWASFCSSWDWGGSCPVAGNCADNDFCLQGAPGYDPDHNPDYYGALPTYNPLWWSSSTCSNAAVFCTVQGTEFDPAGFYRRDMVMCCPVTCGVCAIDYFGHDANGHGTHVAGTVAAKAGNNQGVLGVFPGVSELKIVKALAGGTSAYYEAPDGFYSSWLIYAVQECIDSGAKIISMSLGGVSYSSTENAAFQDFFNDGILFIAAAGNDGTGGKSYPASYSSVISVGATDSDDNYAAFSQYNDEVDIAAPGVDILSTSGTCLEFVGGECRSTSYSYKTLQGTSMAAPHVSGVALLLWNKYPGSTNSDVRAALEAGAQDQGTNGYDVHYGHGIVSYWGAVAQLPPPAPPEVPTSNLGLYVGAGVGGAGASLALLLLFACYFSRRRAAGAPKGEAEESASAAATDAKSTVTAAEPKVVAEGEDAEDDAAGGGAVPDGALVV